MRRDNVTTKYFSETHYIASPEASVAEDAIVKAYRLFASEDMQCLVVKYEWHQRAKDSILQLLVTPRDLQRFNSALSKRTPHFIGEVDDWDICLLSAIEARDPTAFSFLVNNSSLFLGTTTMLKLHKITRSELLQYLIRLMVAIKISEAVIDAICILYVTAEGFNNELVDPSRFTRAAWSGHWSSVLNGFGTFAKVEFPAREDFYEVDKLFASFEVIYSQNLPSYDKANQFIEVVSNHLLQLKYEIRENMVNNVEISVGNYMNAIGKFTKAKLDVISTRKISLRAVRFLNEIDVGTRCAVIKRVFENAYVSDIFYVSLQFHCVEKAGNVDEYYRLDSHQVDDLKKSFLEQFQYKCVTCMKDIFEECLEPIHLLYRVKVASDDDQIHLKYLKSLFSRKPLAFASFVSSVQNLYTPVPSRITKDSEQIFISLLDTKEAFFEIFYSYTSHFPMDFVSLIVDYEQRGAEEL